MHDASKIEMHSHSSSADGIDVLTFALARCLPPFKVEIGAAVATDQECHSVLKLSWLGGLRHHLSILSCCLTRRARLLNYLLIHVHITYMVWALLAASKAPSSSKQPLRSNMTSDLKSVTPITYLSERVEIM